MFNQQLKIQQVCNYNNLFHPPVPNNYVYILVPQKTDLKAYLDDIANQTFPLNHADMGLLEFCKNFFKENIIEAIVKWEKCLESKVNLLSVHYAKSTVEYIEQEILKENFSNYAMRVNPKIINNFISIPGNSLKSFRINLYLYTEHVYKILKRIISDFILQPELSILLERIEIAKEGLKNPENNNFPKLIIYLKSDFLNYKEYFLLLIKYLRKIMGKNNDKANDEYSFLYSNSMTLSQGFKLYKRYLKMLNVIDVVYAKEANWAFYIEQSVNITSIIKNKS